MIQDKVEAGAWRHEDVFGSQELLCELAAGAALLRDRQPKEKRPGGPCRLQAHGPEPIVSIAASRLKLGSDRRKRLYSLLQRGQCDLLAESRHERGLQGCR